MCNNQPLKVFCSYCHADESFLNEFQKHTSLLTSSNEILLWCDRKLIPGQTLQELIMQRIHDSDIVCLFISSDYLSSPSCKKEMIAALDDKIKKATVVIPIILRPCSWLDDSDISSLLALPNDGKAISEYKDNDSAWVEVYKGLKTVIENTRKILNITISDNFMRSLLSMEMLSMAHSNKTEVTLEDIFVYPELSKFGDVKNFEKRISSKTIADNFHDYSKLLIAGEDQSGKTTLCKKFFIELYKRRMTPIYIQIRSGQTINNIEKELRKAFYEQYENGNFDEMDMSRVVPIVEQSRCAARSPF